MFPKSRTENHSTQPWAVFILMCLPDPISVLRQLSQLVRPGGVVAFQEPHWVPVLSLLAPLILWSAAASLIHKTFQQSGANPELGPALYRAFQEAGLPGPTMRLEMPMGKDPDTARWFSDIICTLRPQIEQFNLPVDSLGKPRYAFREASSRGYSIEQRFCLAGPVGAWVRKS